VQTWAQAHLPATRAAIIMTMEPVFAGLFAVLLGGERLGPRELVGGARVRARCTSSSTPRAARRARTCAEERSAGVTHVGPV
jgi:threonine/homoserine efflux transporter RhtA